MPEAPDVPVAPAVPQIPATPTVEPPPSQGERTAPPVPRTYYPTALPESAFVLPKWKAADAEIAFDADERSTF